jgi:hypothetical protein
MRLGVIADTRHHLDHDGRPATLEPVAAQVERLAELFDEVEFLGPLWPGPPPPGFRAYRSANVSLTPIRAAGGATAAAKAQLALRVPSWSAGIARLLGRVDAVHLRAPCNVALLALLALRVSSRPRAAMYAGNWHGYDGEPATYRLQRRLLGLPSFGGPVTVYTDRPPGRPHIVPFFSPSFTLEEWEAESAVVEAKLAAPSPATVRLVTVGYVDANKNQGVVVEAVRLLREGGIDARLDVVGDGPLLDRLTAQRDALGLTDCVRLRGRLPLAEVRQCYRDAHVNILASRTEGYPKVVAEGMVCGAVPVTSRFPLAETMLAGGARGVTFPHDDAAALAAAVTGLVHDPDRLRRMIMAGRSYARTVTLDAFGDQMRAVLEESWGVSTRATSPRR